MGKAWALWHHGPVELFCLAYIIFVGAVLLIATVIEVTVGFIIGAL